MATVNFNHGHIKTSSAVGRLRLDLGNLSSVVLLASFLGRAVVEPVLCVVAGKQAVAPKKPSSKGSASSEGAFSGSASSGAGHKVQVFYLAARSKNPNAPDKDALWFATYPIVPRMGDCLFRDGVYYRVERVFLYENLAAGWCADVEVSFYSRR